MGPSKTMTTTKQVSGWSASTTTTAAAMTLTSSKKQSKNDAKTVTPTYVPSSSHNEKALVDELLLVCGMIGTTSIEPDVDTSSSSSNSKVHPTFVPLEDCSLWLQDLQRTLRRDDDQSRFVAKLIHQWRIVPTKLLPLIYDCRYDTKLVITVLKILVILTKPLHENTIRAGRMALDTNPKISEEYVCTVLLKSSIFRPVRTLF
jgi:timeless